MSTATSTTEVCQWCAQHHEGVCHMIKSIEYYQDGSIQRVEFKGAGDYEVAQVPQVQDYTLQYPFQSATTTTTATAWQPLGLGEGPSLPLFTYSVG